MTRHLQTPPLVPKSRRTSGQPPNQRPPTVKRGQYVHYRLVEDHLANTLNGYLQEVCPVSGPLKAESAEIKRNKMTGEN